VLPSVTKTQSPISKITVALNDKEAQTRLQKSFDGKLDPSNFLCRKNVEAVENADAVLFAFPPEKIHEVLAEAEMRKALRHKIMISILARTPRAEIAQIINGQDTPAASTADNLRIVRAMPTMGTEVHESATLIGKSSNPLESEAVELGAWIFNSVGRVFHVTHDYFDAATGMSAFSNALTTTAVQVIAQQAVAEGIPKDHAIAIASQCIRGMASLMLSGTSPEQLQWSLSAPGSITGQAISRLKESQLSAILESSVSAAIRRAKEYRT
jgi:pyrroline-5-carboxylate reductase